MKPINLIHAMALLLSSGMRSSPERQPLTAKGKKPNPELQAKGKKPNTELQAKAEVKRQQRQQRNQRNQLGK